MSSEELIDATTALTAASDAVDNPQTEKISYGRRHRAWWHVSRFLSAH